MGNGATVTVDDDDVRVVVEGTPCLVRVLRCDRPLEPSTRISLDGVERAVIGRGELGESLIGDELVISVPDDRMSTTHARLSHEGRTFVLEDDGLKNGTLVNGRRCEVAELVDGDVIETGHTFFVYRARVPRGMTSEPARFATGEGTGDVALTTLLPSLARQLARGAQVAPSTVPVILLGETGTGKEVVARALHRLSRRGGPFLAINCGAIPANLIESELFGARKGAFSGAVEDRPGLVRAADGGTLFLDEIGELPPPAQIALLRVLQEQEVMPIGATRPIKVDVRIVAATHRPLDQMVGTGGFRADLFARLGGLTIRLPALRDRREDLGLIIQTLLERLTPAADRIRLSRQATRALFLYPFPHNIRELEKMLGLALAIASAPDGPVEVGLDAFPDELRAPPLITSPEPRRADPESDADDAGRRAQLVALLTEHRGRIAAVARAMGKARMQIHRWIQRYEIDLDSFRQG